MNEKPRESLPGLEPTDSPVASALPPDPFE
jgi:hypothetical protein